MSSAECHRHVWKVVPRAQRLLACDQRLAMWGIFNRVFYQENWELVCHKKINVLPERCFHLDHYRHRPPDKASYEIKLYSHTACVIAYF